MYPVTERFLAAIRQPHALSVHVEARRLGVPVGGTLQVLDGSVTAEASRVNSPRRTLNVELVPTKGLWDALAPAGTMLYAYRGIRYVDGTTERVPLGVFDVDEQSLSADPGGGLRITAPDLWVRVQRKRFEKPTRTPAGSAHDLAVSTAEVAVGLGTGTLAGDTTITTRSAIWPRDREDAVNSLARAARSWIYCDATGKIATRQIPSLNQTPVWTVDASAAGVLLDADRTRSRQRTYNIVIVLPAESDGKAPFNPVTIADDDPTSPTYVGGAFGRVPFFYSNQLVNTAAEATTMAVSLLRRVKGLAAQLDLTSVVNPALEPGDVIQVLLPPRAGNTFVAERHLIDSVTIPLTAGGTQSISTRSSRPDGDVPEGD